jgi:hypothetical protein
MRGRCPDGRLLTVMTGGLSVLVFGSSYSAVRAADPKKMPVLADRTPVAWVYPANLIQRGGSDFFRRTHRNQGAWLTETADPNAPVPISVLHRGREVTVCRNGQPYSQQEIDRPQVFTAEDAMAITYTKAR